MRRRRRLTICVFAVIDAASKNGTDPTSSSLTAMSLLRCIQNKQTSIVL